jgi:uncharacterized protein YodC (DUF2158 family)
VLAALAGAAGASTAGCLEERTLQPDEGTPTDREDGGSPTGGDSAGSCPDYDEVERVVCLDDVDRDAVDVVLVPARRAVELDDPVTFTLRNRADRTLATNFYNWNVHKQVDGTWYHVAPHSWNQPLMHLGPGEEHAWEVTFTAGSVEAGEPVRVASGTGAVTVAGVGGGRYAFRARGWFEGDGHEQAQAFAATFDLDAPSLKLAPTNAIESTEWNGDVLVARSSRGDPDDEDYRLGAYELERVDDPGEDVRRLVTEQVVRHDLLRDALALALEHDADRVSVREYDATHPLFGLREPQVFAFRDGHYEMSAREVEGD